MSRVILASASPRRRELLKLILEEYEVLPSGAQEHVTATEPAAVVEELSALKAGDVFLSQTGVEDLLVIGADTIVALDGQILGKPGDRQEALEMLRMLRGRKHQVYTGVTLVQRREGSVQKRTFHECTEVTFYPLTEEEIQNYVDTMEPMDKAGAYGIQGKGVFLVERICGDYNNVVGLPVARLYQEMKQIRR